MDTLVLLLRISHYGTGPVVTLTYMSLMSRAERQTERDEETKTISRPKPNISGKVKE